jgi:hypothetical protein
LKEREATIDEIKPDAVAEGDELAPIEAEEGPAERTTRH